MSMQPHTRRIPIPSLGNRLRLARETAHMEQGELADLLEISRGSVSAYERDVTVPKGLVIRAWAFETGVDEWWLRTGKPGPDDPGPGFLRVAGEGFEPSTSGLHGSGDDTPFKVAA